MFHALVNDLAQRIVSFNRLQTRRQLARHLEALGLKAGDSVLDFGCGTGLNAGTFLRRDLRYTGYDIDPRLTRYAAWLYPAGTFTMSRQDLQRLAPFDLVLAHCVFHHIDDAQAAELLGWLKGLLSPSGRLLLIDLLRDDDVRSRLRRLYRKLERGRHLRTREEYLRMVEGHFRTEAQTVMRSHLLSCPIRINPVYSRLLALRLCPT